MKLSNFSQNLPTVYFSKFSTPSKFSLFYEEPIWFDVIILDEIDFFQNQIFKDKKRNSFGIYPKLAIIC